MYVCSHSQETSCEEPSETRGLTLEADVESTVEEVMAVDASLTVVLDSCSPVPLDMMRAPGGLHKNTHREMFTV